MAPPRSLSTSWLESLLGTSLPRETRATCSSCAMCATSNTSPEVPAYRPSAKCCTYWPTLPNYLVGAILASGASELQEGTTRLRKCIDCDYAVPLGVGAPLSYRIMYSGLQGLAFGRNDLLLCPYFSSADGGTCTIWSYRNSVCSTFFCKFERGQVSERFWNAAKHWLVGAERAVSVWCARELGLSTTTLRRVPPSAELFTPDDLQHYALDVDESHTPPADLWGNWEGRRREFYRACFEKAHTLSFEDLQGLLGIDGAVAAAEVRSCHEALVATQMPSRVRSARVALLAREPTRVLLKTYRSSDPQWVDADLFNSLRHFDGRPVVEALRACAADGVVCSEETLHRLLDFGVVADASER